MNFHFEHACPRGHPVAGNTARRQGPSAPPLALCGHRSAGGSTGAPQGHEPGPRSLNHVYITGVVLEEPRRDMGRRGERVQVLLIAFAAPQATDDLEDWRAAGSEEIEVALDVAERCEGELKPGAPVLVTGHLAGGGGVVARQIWVGPEPPPPSLESIWPE